MGWRPEEGRQQGEIPQNGAGGGREHTAGDLPHERDGDRADEHGGVAQGKRVGSEEEEPRAHEKIVEGSILLLRDRHRKHFIQRAGRQPDRIQFKLGEARRGQADHAPAEAKQKQKRHPAALGDHTVAGAAGPRLALAGRLHELKSNRWRKGESHKK